MAARVLVVDDSPTIRKLVSAILARHDYEAAQAADGQAGLDRLRQGGVDLVLLDFVMPRMNGYQFCREMRADETLRHLPVVLMSAKGDKIRGQFVQQTGRHRRHHQALRRARALGGGGRRAAEDGRGAHPAIDSIRIEREVPSSRPPAAKERDRPTPLPRKNSWPKRTSRPSWPKSSPTSWRPRSPQMAEPRRSDAIAIAGTIRRALGPDTFEELGRAVRDLNDKAETVGGLRRQPEGHPARRGAASACSFNGRPAPVSSRAAKSRSPFRFAKGSSISRASKGAADEFRLGRYLVEEGVVSQTDVDNILQDKSGAA